METQFNNTTFKANISRDSEEIEVEHIEYDRRFHKKCQLLPEADIFLDFFPGNSLKERFVRKINRWRAIQEDGFVTKDNFRSSQIIKGEVLDHIILHNYSIHPYSRLR